MITYRGAAIYQSYIEHCWTAVFGYGDYVQSHSFVQAVRSVDLRRDT